MWPHRPERVARIPALCRRTPRRFAEGGGADERAGARFVGSSSTPDQQATARSMATLDQRLVELLSNRPLATRNKRPPRLDSSPYPQRFLDSMENSARPDQRLASPGSQRAIFGQRLLRKGGLGYGPTLGHAPSPQEPDAGTLWGYYTVELRRAFGNHRMTPARVNRRMRKPACPVVWKGHGAQSP